MSLVDVLLYLLALVGHGALWITVINRVHAVGLPKRTIGYLTRLAEVPGAAMPLVFAYRLEFSGPASLRLVGASPQGWDFLWWAYLGLCWAVAIGPVPVSLARRLFARPPASLRSTRHTSIDLSEFAQPVRGTKARLAVAMPGNQVFQLDVADKTLAIDRLDPRLEGLSIAHVSDFHLIGHVARGYYEQVVDQTNALGADLVAITGDLVDTTECLAWIPHVFGRLRAKHGVYFILGNHDRRVDSDRLRRELAGAGLIDLGGRSTVVSIDGGEVLLAGNEVPWFRPAAQVPPRSAAAAPALRVLLSHSPDQFPWAVREDFDLVLAGHTHGGQVRFPGFGVLACPSHFGARYAAGVFRAGPTVLHVTRGVSSEVPLRYNCPPEVALLRLVRAASQPSSKPEAPARVAASG